tara:strand:- start:14408 stop:15415 length:1008 start_codon:yes stop_codon:yes gene_type:complete
MIKAQFHKKTFHFKLPSGTSRGVLTEKHAWFIEIWKKDQPSIIGIGECSIIPGLSPDFETFELYEQKLIDVCKNLSLDLQDWPSIKFGVECAMLNLKNGGGNLYFDNPFSRGQQKISINGLIWMGSKDFMQQQIEEKILLGFSVLKMKIGSIDFETELNILRTIRKKFSSAEITLRVDANGAFTAENALNKLQSLAKLDIHSVEQPIKAGQYKEMQKLCLDSPLKIALDEELIGVNELEEKIQLLDTIQPPFIILKPSLHGGISGCEEWIQLAEERKIEWWMTSALESNIGLNAICQFVGEYDNELPQGLGTGSLYTDNITSDLVVKRGQIYLSL